MEEEIWQQYQILKKGKSQIVRRKNGPRLNNTIVYHLIGHEITTAQINTLKVSYGLNCLHTPELVTPLIVSPPLNCLSP